jgi:hypothetical protein
MKKKFLLGLFVLAICGIAWAASNTTYYNLYKPATGDKNWGALVNTNFDVIDTTLHNKADLASPTFTGTVSGITKSMVGLGSVDNTSDTNKPVSTAQQTALDLKVDDSEKGAASGVATLGVDGKLTSSQLPAALTGAVAYKGLEDASDGSFPAGTLGDYYIISIAGTVDGSLYSSGDWIVYSTKWDQINNASPSTGWTAGSGVVYTTTESDDVGIGTSTPSSALEVVGTVTATAFAGDITGELTGNAATATKLATARTINGHSFDGTANITIGQGDIDLSLYADKASYVPKTTTINAKPLSGNIVLSQSDIDLSLYATLASPVFTTPNIGSATGSISGNAATATALASNPTDCTGGQFANSIDASGNLTCSSPAGGISGLTTNYVTKATGATAIGDSIIFDNGTNVGIGDATPSTKLEVNGTITATAFAGNASTASALAANGTNCSGGQVPLGVSAAGAAESCWVPGATVIVDGTTYPRTSTGIGSAITAAGTNGSIWLTDGDYDMTAMLQIWTSGLTIAGGKKAILKRAASTADDMLQVYGTHFTLRGVTLDGNTANQTNSAGHTLALATSGENHADYATIDDVKVINSRWSGIFVNAPYARIQNVRMIDNTSLRDTGYGAIYIWSDSDFTTIDNVYIENSPCGITTWDENWSITNTSFKNITKSQCSAIMGYHARRFNINNINIDTTYHSDVGANCASPVGNECKGVNGIFVASEDASDDLFGNISNVVGKNIGAVGLELQGNYNNVVNVDLTLYHGGTGTSADQNGMFIAGNHNRVSNFVVRDSWATGILVVSSTGNVFTDGSIYNSEYNGFSPDDMFGAVTNTTLQNTLLIDNQDYGIGSYHATTVSDVRLINNTFSGNVSGEIDAAILAKLTGIDIDGTLYANNASFSGTGNVGIGVSNPTKKLSVDGTIYFNPASLSADGGGGSKLGINVDGTIYKY